MKRTLLALLALAALTLVVLLVAKRERPGAPAPVAGLAAERAAAPESPAAKLEALEEPIAPAGRSEAAPPAAAKAASPAWYVEMKNSPLRAKMREYARAEEWEKKYAAYTDADLRKEQDKLDLEIKEKASTELERRFASGEYEVVSTDGVYRGPSYNTCEVYWVQCSDGKVWKKAALPEQGFEGVYKLKAQSTWLSEFAHDREPVLSAR